MLNKLCLAMILLVPPLLVTGQSVHFDSGVSIRNKEKAHYYKMVEWDEGQYEEFAYWEESEAGSIVEFLNWRAYFPPSYDQSSGQKYPMVVMLHGAGESGRKYSNVYDYAPTDPEYDNNSHQLLFGGMEHMEAANKPASDPNAFPGIMVFPQVSYNGSWDDTDASMLIKVVEYMIGQYNADPDRIAIHGLSNGAKGAWKVATMRPDLFSAVLSMSGVGTEQEVMTDSLATTPVWIFQGSRDTNPSPEWSKTWVDMINAKGGEARYTLYNDQGHSIWNNAYAEPDFFSWMRATDKKNIRFMGGEPDPSCNLTSDNPVKLGISAGYLSYQWNKDGLPIAGATGRYYTPTSNGTYTVSFKRRTNNTWAESNPATIFYTQPGFAQQKPSLTASGSTNLPIPFSEGIDQTLNLEAPAGYGSYSWYKNGILLETSESAVYNLNDASGEKFVAADAGDYAVVVTDRNGCSTLMSDPVSVTYTPDDGSGGGGSAPADVEKVVISGDEIDLSWSDTEDETSFEVWRARSNTFSQDGDKISGYPGKQYQHVATLPANTLQYTDSGLRPGASYNYRIRAIKAEASAFSEEENNFVTTQNDTSAPTAPANLVVTHTTESEIYLQWDPSTDDDVVYRYEIFLDGEKIADVQGEADDDPTDGSPAPATSFVVTGDLKFRTLYELQVRAADYQGNNFEGNASAFSNSVASEVVLGSSSEEELRAKATAYPNPFQTRVIVKLPGKQREALPVLVFDHSGRLIKNAGNTGPGDEVAVELGDIEDGYYILSVGPYKFRVIKKN